MFTIRESNKHLFFACAPIFIYIVTLGSAYNTLQRHTTKDIKMTTGKEKENKQTTKIEPNDKTRQK
jgi:hypothetical protein